MQQRRKWIRRIGRALGSLGIGAMLGFLVPTIVSDFSPPPPQVQLSAVESPVARQFIEAYVRDDQSTLTAMGLNADVRLRAARLRADFPRIDELVHLGSTVGGGFTLHAYSAHVVKRDGTDGLLSWRVATAGGQVLLIPPPSSIEQP